MLRVVSLKALAPLLFLLAPIPMLAQMITASLEGTVLDSTGAVIPSAKVRIANTATQCRRVPGNRQHRTVPGNQGFSSGQFGVISSQANSPRQLQFALKVLF